MSSDQMRNLIESLENKQTLAEESYAPHQTVESINSLSRFFSFLSQNMQQISEPVNPYNPRTKKMLEGAGIETDFNTFQQLYEQGKWVLGGPGMVSDSLIRDIQNVADLHSVVAVFSVRASLNNAYRMDMQYIIEGILKDDNSSEVRIAYVSGKEAVIVDGTAVSRRELYNMIGNS